MDLVSCRQMRTRKLAPGWALAALPMMCLLLGCGGVKSSLSSPTNPDPFVLYINASPDVGGLDFYADNDKVVANAPYAPGLPEFMDFQQLPFREEDGGAWDIAITQVNSPDELDAISPTLSLNTSHIVVAAGLYHFDNSIFTEYEKRLTLFEFVVDRRPPNGNRARLIVVHAFMRSPGNLTPPLRFQTPGRNPTFQVNGIIFAGNKSFEVDSGTWTFEAKRDDLPDGAVFATRTATLAPGAIYLVIVSGVEDSPDPLQQPKITFIQIPSRV